jgi:cardiolipin synthase A/B
MDAEIAIPAVLALALLSLVLVLALVLWSVKRHSDPKLEVDCDQPLDELVEALAGLTHGTRIAGNAVEILENEHYFDAMLADVAQARHSVHFETFLWKDGELGTRVAAALAERGRAGVKVRVLLDANGCKAMGVAACRTLHDAGCRVVRYHAKRLRNIGVLNRRDHRKTVVLDGRIAYVGGHCIVDEWQRATRDRTQVRDLSVRLEGPAVHAVQSAFSENWVDETGELFVGDGVFPKLEPAGKVAVHVARVKPERAAPAVKILHHLVLCVARRRIWIQNPYFLPEPEAIQAMIAAVRRGVDVRVMTPSAKASDMSIVQHAAHHNFTALLRGGVRMFEYQKTLLHQKVMTIDGAWCCIGSSNFDDRSFEINDEITLGLHDAGMAERFEAIFERDLKDCVELELARWQQRGTRHKLLDRTLYLFNEQL